MHFPGGLAGMDSDEDEVADTDKAHRPADAAKRGKAAVVCAACSRKSKDCFMSCFLDDWPYVHLESRPWTLQLQALSRPLSMHTGAHTLDSLLVMMPLCVLKVLAAESPGDQENRLKRPFEPRAANKDDLSPTSQKCKSRLSEHKFSVLC